MDKLGVIDVDHRGEACRWALEQLPGGLARYGDPRIQGVGVRRTALEVGDVEWDGYNKTRNYVELKLVDDFINSIKSGHMAEQEMKLLEAGGRAAVMLIGQVEPQEDPSLVITRRESRGFLGTTSEIEHVFAYASYLNYQVHLQEMGIDVVTVCDWNNIGIALAALYTRSLRAPRGERIIKRKVVSVSNEANAVKALYPNMRLSVKACESLAKVAGVKLGTEWMDELRAKRGGELIVGEVVEALPHVGRDTIKRLFGV